MRYVILHGHIFKNAGSTVDTALRNAFGKGFVEHTDDKAMRDGGADYLKKLILENQQVNAISSHHLCNPLPIHDDFICIPIYFLRDPIERIISVYEFERKQRGVSLGSKKAIELSLIDYVKWRFSESAPKTISNYQTAYIGSHKNLHPHEKVCSSMFDTALSKIENKMTLVGCVERFDNSWHAIRSRLDIYFPGYDFSYKNTNVRSSSDSDSKYFAAVQMLNPILDEIVRENIYDVSLHKLVMSRFL